MAILERCPEAIRERVDYLVDMYHAPLRDAGVTIDLWFSKAATDDNGDPVGPALKLHGYACAGVAKINSYELRKKGHGDTEIKLDGDRWDEWSQAEQDAILDHELEHFELCVDKKGRVKRDDADRPKVRCRKHDHQFGWFDAIAKRHGPASIEVQQFQHMVTNFRQLYLSFDESDTPQIETHSSNGDYGDEDHIESVKARMQNKVNDSHPRKRMVRARK